MSEPSYDAAPFPVRQDITDAHRLAWRRLAQPGSWLSGEERVAIAAETRNAMNCSLCRGRKAALSPRGVKGNHTSLGGLPEPVVEIVHHVRTDPGRITKAWFDGLVPDSVEDTTYVEIISAVTLVVGIDVFSRGVGVDSHPLPDPEAGEPSRDRPASARFDGAWVPMIAADVSEGPEADIYGTQGFVPNIRRALSLVPDSVRLLNVTGAAHYFDFDEMMDVTRGRSISRPQVELIAARVSALNECFY
jgi:hypothetical protein